MEMPTGPQSLTAEWLTSALRTNGIIDLARVKSFTCKALELEKGTTGGLFRVIVTYDIDEVQAPLSLIAKFPTSNQDELEVMFSQTFHYEREVRFYERIADSIALRTPRCYFSDIDVAARKYILLLEDLTPARSASSEEGCSPEEAELAIREIATLHATWWEKPGLDGMTGWLPQWDMRHFTMFQDVYQNGWPSFADKMGARLTPDMIRIGEQLGHHVSSVMDYNRQSPRTLTHFDYQLDNIFFPQPEATDTLIVVDWQVINIGRGVIDVSNLIGGNIEPGTRAAVEMDLIKMYHQCLIENGVQAYSFQQCLKDYKVSMLNHLARHIIVTLLMDLTPDMEHRFLDIVIPRYFDAVLDLKAHELLPL